MHPSLKSVLASPEFIELNSEERWLIDLKYATADNFMNRNVYLDFNRAFLHKAAFSKLEIAAKNLKQNQPRYRFIIYDALRPRSIQYILWDKVKGTSQEQYVANPERGSMHNYGFAIDLSIVDEKNNILDMGTGFDEFSALSQPQLEEQFLKEGLLQIMHFENRLLLRNAMTAAGFIQLPHEWWHFDALTRAEVTAKYQIIE